MPLNISHGSSASKCKQWGGVVKAAGADLGKSTEQSVHETGQVQSMPEDNAPMVNQDGSWTGCTLFLQRIVERLH